MLGCKKNKTKDVEFLNENTREGQYLWNIDSISGNAEIRYSSLREKANSLMGGKERWKVNFAYFTNVSFESQ